MKKFSILIVVALFLFNCQKEVEHEDIHEEEPAPTLEVKYSGMSNGLGEKILLDTISKTAIFHILTNQKDWQFQAEINDKLPEEEKWLSLSKSGNNLHIKAKDNYTDIDRKEKITISVSNKSLYHTESITQYSYDPPLESFIPDIFFRKKVMNSCDWMKINSRREARRFIERIFIGSGGNDSYIRSLVGIEALQNLKQIECKLSQLRTIDKLPNLSKVGVYLHGNSLLESINLTSLDSLSSLHISDSRLLNKLDLNDLSSLKSFSLKQTSVDNLNLKNATTLQWLSIIDNNINVLDISQNRKLDRLEVYEKNLDKLDVSKNTNISHLEFGGKSIHGGTINEYIYYRSPIIMVDLSKNTELKTLIFNYTSISSIDLSNNKKITNLDCRNNQLKVLDISNCPDLLYLDCRENPLEIIYVKKGFDINNPLPSYKIPQNAVYKVKE
jgi:hypothetical protein